MKPLLAKTSWNDEFVAIFAIEPDPTDRTRLRTLFRYVDRSGSIGENLATQSFWVIGGLPDHWAPDWLEPTLERFKAWEEKARNGV